MRYPVYEMLYWKRGKDNEPAFTVRISCKQEEFLELPEEVSEYLGHNVSWRKSVSQAEAETYQILAGIPIMTPLEIIKWAAKEASRPKPSTEDRPGASNL